MGTSTLSKRIISLLLSLTVAVGCFGTLGVFADDAPLGTVFVSFEDFGVRVDGDEDYPDPLGIIVERVEIPFYEDDTIATVTLRVLDDAGIGYSYTGTPESGGGFYLSQIKNFYCESLDETIPEFGEFYSGTNSGWMITLNNWFINMGASEFYLEDGDIIRWQNTCQLGADIGCNWSNGSAKITGLEIDEKYGTLEPEFDPDIENYFLQIPTDANAVRVEALQENYWATLTYRVGDTYYKLLRDIPVKDCTEIVIECAFAEYAGNPPTDTDIVTILVYKELETLKIHDKAELAAYKNADDYRAAQKIELADAVLAGNTAIDAATDAAGVSASLANAKAAIDAIKTAAQLTSEELATAKTSAKAELSEYKNADDYRAAQKIELADAVLAGNTAIDSATDAAGVNIALANAKAVIDAIKTNAQPITDELATAKNSAKAELAAYKNAADYRAAQQTELANAVSAGNTAIDAATDAAGVNTAQANAKTAIDAIKTDAQLTAEELATAKTSAKAKLAAYKDAVDYRAAQQTELANAVSAGNTAIDAATDAAGVNTALANAKTAIDAIKTDAQLTEEESIGYKISQFFDKIKTIFASIVDFFSKLFGTKAM